MRLANRFAPIALYDPAEPNLPTRVDIYLSHTQLWFFSKYCQPPEVLMASSIKNGIPIKAATSCQGAGEAISSHGSRSIDKNATFYLSSIAPNFQRGSADLKDWVTYVHAFPNEAGGVTLQYWRFYAYNTGYWHGVRAWLGDHGGDWEAVHVVLGRGPDYRPLELHLLGHADISKVAWGQVPQEDGHPLIACAKGGHTSEIPDNSTLRERRKYISHQSWTGGRITWPDTQGERTGGGLILIGQKTHPMPGFEWIRYSGLWGTRQDTAIAPYYRSGYWGPAFNETGMRSDGFVSAWCDGMSKTAVQSVHDECFASRQLP